MNNQNSNTLTYTKVGDYYIPDLTWMTSRVKRLASMAV